jgi:prepilin peptidase CpaA
MPNPTDERTPRPVLKTDVQIVTLLVASIVFAFVAFSDLRTRRIPNEFIVVLLALAAVRIAVTGNPTAALYTLIASAAVFVAGFLLFWRGLLGGGDVKLIGATGLLIGYHDLFEFLFVMSVCGGLVALAILAGDKLGFGPTAPADDATPSPELQEKSARLTVPYGVAIALAAIFTLLVQTRAPG